MCQLPQLTFIQQKETKFTRTFRILRNKCDFMSLVCLLQSYSRHLELTCRNVGHGRGPSLAVTITVAIASADLRSIPARVEYEHAS